MNRITYIISIVLFVISLTISIFNYILFNSHINNNETGRYQCSTSFGQYWFLVTVIDTQTGLIVKQEKYDRDLSKITLK